MTQVSQNNNGTAKLTYFDVRGRAEVIRLILEDHGAPYTERRVSLEEWPELKSSFSFGQLPTYQDGDLLLNQSNAIYRFLARKFDLYGRSEIEHSRCDMIQEALVDMQNSLGGLFWNPDFDNLRADYEANELTTNLGRLENLLIANKGGNGFFVGDDITYVDYIVWHHLDYVRAFAPHVLARYAQLVAFKNRFESRPNVATYLASDRRPKTLTVAMASFGGTPETS